MASSAKKQKLDKSVNILQLMNKQELIQLVKEKDIEIEALKQKVEILRQENQSYEKIEIELLKEKDAEIEILRHEQQGNEIIKSMKSVQKALKSDYFKMDEIVRNPMYSQIAQEIFGYLNPRDLKRSCLVSKVWNQTIKEGKPWWKLRLKHVTYKKLVTKDFCEWSKSEEDISFVEAYEEFRSPCIYVRTHETLGNIRIFTQFLEEFIAEDYHRIDLCKTPLHWAAYKGRLDVFEIFAKTSIDFELSKSKHKFDEKPLDIACEEGHVGIVKLLYEQRKIRKINFNNGAFKFACKGGHKEVVQIFIDFAKEETLDPNFVWERDHEAEKQNNAVNPDNANNEVNADDSDNNVNEGNEIIPDNGVNPDNAANPDIVENPLNVANPDNAVDPNDVDNPNNLENPDNAINPNDLDNAVNDNNAEIPENEANAENAANEDSPDDANDSDDAESSDIESEYDFDPTPPFFHACFSRTMDPDVVELLFKSDLKIDYNYQDYNGRGKTAFHHAISGKLGSCDRWDGDKCKYGTCTDNRLVDLFIKYSDVKGINLNTVDKTYKNRETPLHTAFHNRCIPKG